MGTQLLLFGHLVNRVSLAVIVIMVKIIKFMKIIKIIKTVFFAYEKV